MTRGRTQFAAMDLDQTLIVLAVAVALTTLCGWMGAREWDIRKGPRMIPWRFMMMLSAIVAAFMLAHLSTLLKGHPPA